MKQLKYVTSLVLLFLMLFAAEGIVAQSGFTNSVLLSDKELSTNGVLLVDDLTAIQLLSETAKSIDFSQNDNASDEIGSTVKMEYYFYLIQEVNSGIGIKTVLESSGPQLAIILNKFKSGYGVTPQGIYAETLNLLEQ